MFRIFGFGKTTPSESKGSQKGQVFPSEGGKLLSTPSKWSFFKFLTSPFYFRARRRSSREEIMATIENPKPDALNNALYQKLTDGLTAINDILHPEQAEKDSHLNAATKLIKSFFNT